MDYDPNFMVRGSFYHMDAPNTCLMDTCWVDMEECLNGEGLSLESSLITYARTRRAPGFCALQMRPTYVRARRCTQE